MSTVLYIILILLLLLFYTLISHIFITIMIITRYFRKNRNHFVSLRYFFQLYLSCFYLNHNINI